MIGRIAAAGLLAAIVASPALANDSTAEVGAGGLTLVYNDSIRIMSEDLYISAGEVRVRYVFRNVTKRPKTYTVAFPLPPIDTAGNMDLNIVLPNPEVPNFVDFQLTIDGVPQTPMTYARATAFGVDRTAELEAAGIPINPASFEMYQYIETVPAETMAELNSHGLFMVEEWGTMPTWQLEAGLYWEQTFPAGRDVVVEHTYKPVVGYGFFGDWAFADDFYENKYCMDDSFEAAARRIMGPAEYGYANEQRIAYILTTGANWLGPIGEFTLTVDKGSTDAIVSFCADGVTRTSPTTFQWRQTDFYPDRELDILLVTPIVETPAVP